MPTEMIQVCLKNPDFDSLDSMKLHDFSADFTQYKDPSFINLNNGTLGLCPDSVIDQQKIELEIFEKNTSHSLGSSWNRLWKIQQRLGSFLKASAQDLFLRPNVTLALNEIIMGVPLKANSEILTTQFEYGAVVNILKYRCQKDGLTLRQENFDFLYESTSDEVFVERLLGYTNSKTSLVLLSHIFTGNGICIPLGKIATALKARGILLVVDGAHAPGRIPLDFTGDLKDVDYYCGNLHKWFMGPKGTAFGWVHPDRQAQLQPLYGSWTTDKNTPGEMQAFQVTPFTECMLWSHSQSFSAYFALESALNFWDHYSQSLIFSEINKRMLFLQESFSKAGLNPVKEMNASCGSVLLGYELAKFSKAIFSGLVLENTQSRVQVGLPRLPGRPLLRLTPHIHNTQEELERAVSALKEVITR